MATTSVSDSRTQTRTRTERLTTAQALVRYLGAQFTEQADFPLLGQLSRSPKVDDRPEADVLFEPGNIRSAHGMQRSTSEKPPPCHGAPVPRPVSAEVSEIRHGFKIDVPWIRLVHLYSIRTKVGIQRVG